MTSFVWGMSQAVEQIKSKLGIVDLISSYIKVEKAGSNFKARCPFHAEKTPSFFISPAKDAYHCFGCNKGGDIFNFIQEIEGVDFIGALKILGDKTGVVIDNMDYSKTPEKSRLASVVEKATRFFRSQLKINNAALEYLKKRGLSDETIEGFSIGFAPDSWRSLYDYLKKEKVPDSDMDKAGLVVRSPKGYYDRFRNRVMFPIRNSSGMIVGFSGRIFDYLDKKLGENVGKYVNSPETLLYDKSAVLYGFDKAKVEIRRTGKCIVVEGQMDLVMAHQAGFSNSVAVSGTALTDRQLSIIKRLADDLIFAFDSDEAGMKATNRSATLALSAGFNVMAVDLFGKKDPADLILENSSDWKKTVDEALHVVDFYIKIIKRNFQDPRIISKEVSRTVLPLIARIENSIDKAQFVGKIARMLGVDDSHVWREIEKIMRQIPEEKNSFEVKDDMSKKDKNKIDALYNKVVGFLAWQESGNPSADWISGAKQRIKELESLENLNFKESIEPLVFEAELYYSAMDDPSKNMSELLNNLEEEILKKKLTEAMAELKKYELKEDEDKIGEYLKKCQEISFKINKLKSKK